MKDIIRLLPDSIANQIAAGEVVQRPSSVVKELLENSIDAGAKNITLIVSDAGKKLVQVVDDGKGMSLTDARMSFERHATSKIQRAEDLFRIRSMGFRGEALASIAAVSQVDLKTRTPNEELGTHIQIEASEFKGQEPVTTTCGTSISVKNLFYNIPARRNFLKSNPVELRHINDEFQRIALANPEIKLRFLQNDQETYLLDPGKLSRRIVQLFGKNYQQQLISVHEETDDIRVTGFLGKPEFAKKTRGEQFFFVNDRFIKNAYLNHAVVQGYEGMLAENSFPFYALFIEMDPKHIDINVHPTKTEVKFDDDRLLYSIILAAVRQALAAHNVTPSLDFDTDVNFAQYNPPSGSGQQDRNYTQFRNIDQPPSAKNWDLLYDIARQEDWKEVERAKSEGTEAHITLRSAADTQGELGISDPKPTLQLHGKYMIRQLKSGMVIVDQCAAHERILYERYLDRFETSTSGSQSVLFPSQIELNPSDMALVGEIRSEIQQLGFDFDVFGANSIVINGVPPELGAQSEKNAFEGLIEQFKSNQSRLKLDHRENLARSLAKRTCLPQGKNLQPEEMDNLIDQLFACKQPNYTPEGNSTFVVLGLDKIASLFKN